MEEKHNHAGHRQRIKNRVKKFGLKSLEVHEILEVLLTYSIPRKDTNALAHNLLHNFSNFSCIIDAEPSQLKVIKGVGEETVLFFSILKDFVDIYLENKKEDKVLKLDTTLKCIEYFRNHFQFKAVECFYVFCLTKTGIYSHHFVVEGESDVEIDFPVQALADNISADKVKKVVVMHTHPKGDISPSLTDIQTTDRIISICTVMGAELVDHVILNETTYFSFKRSGFIKEKTMAQANEDIKKFKHLLGK